MSLSAMRAYEANLPFRFTFGHSLAERNSSQNILTVLNLRLAEGEVFGLGESAPRAYVTGETIDGCLGRLKGYARELFASPFVGGDDLLERLVSLFFAEELDKLPLGASFAPLELACLDALARHWRVPFHKMPSLLAERFSACGSLSSLWQAPPRTHFDWGGVVPFAGKSKLSWLLNFYKFYGFKTVKIKVGADLEEDAAKLAMARAILGPDCILRIDANCAWNLEQAERALARLRPYDFKSIEQPLPASDIEGLCRLRARIPETIVADESLCSIADARTLIAEKACGAFNIRISKVGGIFAALRLIELAGNASLECHLGAQVGESGILASAQRHLALCYPFANVEGAMNLFLLKRDPVLQCQTVPFGAVSNLRADELGLGVSLKAKAMESISRFVFEEPVSTTV